MSTPEKLNYYADTLNRAVREDLLFALDHTDGDKVAIDCGCGAGADIAYLRAQGFTVHAFDIEQDSIQLCRERFEGDEHVYLTCASFSEFDYPNASLLVADSSLFFCPAAEFDKVWGRITQSLSEGGIFCGSFLGPQDSMAGPDYDKQAFWPDVLVFDEAELKAIFACYEILSFNEHKVSKKFEGGSETQWHIYSVVARKNR
jgi:SAM-dependent methyltransferase